MSDPAQGSANTRRLWRVAAVLLAIGIVLPLLVGLFD
jgi:hypothetical protein